jgi:trypsin
MGRSRVALLACLALALSAVPAARAQSPEPRIIGGSTTTIQQYPWQAAVVYDPAKVGGNPFQRQFCGGSLITPYIVLTAAHCVFDTDPQNNSSLDPDDVNVVLGQTTLSTAPPSSEFDVQGVAYQDNYDEGYGPGQGVPANDVGYIVLQSPYNTATPIDIAGAGEGALWDSASPEQITGWGATAESGPGSGGSDTLRVATVPIVADSSCAADYGVYFNSSSMVCAGYPEGGIDTCYGDSGGPMQAALGGGGYRLVGITSWGEGCAQPDAPGVYTRVAGESLRPAVASKVFSLETAFGLPHENVIGGADTDPPETTIASGPSGPTNDPTPTFGFSSDEPDSSFECRFDADPFGPCSGPGGSHTRATPLADGVHTFGVRATDASDNTDPTPASRSFTVDTVAPSDPTLSSPSHTVGIASDDPTVEVSFSGAADGLSGVDGFSYQWSASPTTVPDTSKDAEESATGTTSPALANGDSHYFHLRTRDNAGNWTSTAHLGPFVIETQAEPSPPPSLTPPPTLSAPLDSVPPDGRLSARLNHRGEITLEVGCDEDCTAVAAGLVVAKAGNAQRLAAAISAKKKRKFNLTAARVVVAAGGTATLGLKPKGKKARSTLRKLLKRGARAKAQITVTFTDRAGNSTTERLTVELEE